jgi:hypothetical protein
MTVQKIMYNKTMTILIAFFKNKIMSFKITEKIFFNLERVEELELKNRRDYISYDSKNHFSEKIKMFRASLGDQKFLKVLERSIESSKNSFHSPKKRLIQYLQIEANNDRRKQN